MPVFSRPLIALSLTEPDEGLLRYAARVIAVCDCEDVLIVHVLPEAQGSGDAASVQACLEKMRAEVQRHLPAAAGVKMSFEVVEGPRLDLLLTLSVKHGSDVVILGHRRSRSGRRSLARRLAMVAPCSVWLVPEGVPARISNFLVPIDFSECSADSLSTATGLARAAGIDSCRALHVYFDPSTVRYDEHVLEVLGQEEQEFERFLAGVDTHGVKVEPVFEESTHPAEAILRVAGETAADLLVMNTRGRSRAAAVLLGSVTSKAMAATTVPLLAVKHFGSKMSVLQALLSHRFWEQDPVKTS